MNTHQTSVPLVERVYALISLLFLIGVFKHIIPRVYVDPSRPMSGDTVFQGISVAIYAIASAILLLKHRQAISLLSRNKVLVIFVLFTVVSASWSIAPEVALRRSLALTGTTIFGFYLAVRFRPDELLDLLSLVFALLIVVNLILVLLVPEIGVATGTHEGAWKGVFNHKNTMGRIMTLGALVFWVISQRSQTALPWARVGAVLCLVMVAFSQSRTAWVVAILLLISIPFLRFLRRPDFPFQHRLSFAGLGVGCIAIFLTGYLDVVLILLDRDTTWTGRTAIWASSIEAGLSRLWLGHGYRSFWTDLRIFVDRKYGHGHSSFLDMWLELGIVGTTVFFLTLVTFIRRAFRRLINSRDALGLWYIMFVVYIVSFSSMSQVIPHQGTITWALYVTGLSYLSTVPREARLTSVSRTLPQSPSKA